MLIIIVYILYILNVNNRHDKTYFIQKLYLPLEPGKRGRESSGGGLIVLTISASPTAHNSIIIKATSTRDKGIFTVTTAMSVGSQTL
jgi:hypothetical protein